MSKDPMAQPHSKSRQSRKSGLSPGTLLHVGRKRSEQVRIRVFDYDAVTCQERELGSVEECFPYLDSPTTTWINIDGLHDTQVIDTIGQKIDLHVLVREDIVNTYQRPKVEDHEKNLFLVMKMLSVNTREHLTTVEQISFVLGPSYVITFQEGPGDGFDAVRARIRNIRGRHREKGADYLLYSLVDAVVDEYFLALESIGDVIEELETKLITNPQQELLRMIYRLKRDVIGFRKAIWPSREVLAALERSDSHLFHRSTKIYLRDVYDHTIQVIETLDSLREIVASLLETYLSSVSNRKVLTLIATIFIPLTFIAGIYGMNFRSMPELEWTWFYPLGFWGLILLVGGSMAWYFRKRTWL
jgi:magnesium transporter